jgi:hypothetical protein
MKRRSFLGLLGIAAVAPVIVKTAEPNTAVGFYRVSALVDNSPLPAASEGIQSICELTPTPLTHQPPQHITVLKAYEDACLKSGTIPDPRLYSNHQCEHLTPTPAYVEQIEKLIRGES